MRPFVKQAFVVAGASLNIAGHGSAHGYPAVLFAQLAQEDGPIKLTDHDTSWIASAVGAMGIIGTFVSPALMSRWGRQKAHLLTTIPALIGWVIFFYANSISLFVLARLLHGLALGLRTPLAAILVAEYADPRYRGAFLGTFAVSLGLGILLSHFWGSYLTWRMTALVCALFPLFSMIIIALSPESPSWLISKGKFEEGKKAFKWLRGKKPKQKKELDDLITAQKKETAEQTDLVIDKKVLSNTIKDLLKIFRKKEFYKPAIVSVCMLVVYEFSGAHLVPAYGNTILQSVLDKKTAKEVTWQFTCVDLLRTVCAFVAIFLLKSVKRRTILFTSGAATVISMSTISIFVYLRNDGMITQPWILSALPMTLIIIYTLAFCLGLLPLCWVICGEVFPLAYRSLGSTLSTSFLTPAFVVTMKSGPYLFSSVGVEGAFLVYSAILTVCLGIIYSLLPETKDKTLQEIENSFKGNNTSDCEAEFKLMPT